ncbi:MAG: hypothetical protein ACYC9J_15205 [Sulfuricaulis sp.]
MSGIEGSGSAGAGVGEVVFAGFNAGGVAVEVPPPPPEQPVKKPTVSNNKVKDIIVLDFCEKIISICHREIFIGTEAFIL